MSNLINCTNMAFERAVTVSLFIIIANHYLGGVLIKWVRGLFYVLGVLINGNHDKMLLGNIFYHDFHLLTPPEHKMHVTVSTNQFNYNCYVCPDLF